MSGADTRNGFPRTATLLPMRGAYRKDEESQHPRMENSKRPNYRKIIVIAHDFVMTAAAVMFSYWIRIGDELFGNINFAYAPHFAVGVACASFLVYRHFNMYKSIWRFASIYDFMNISKAVTTVSVGIVVFSFLLGTRLFPDQIFTSPALIVLYWGTQIALLLGPRVLYRYYKDWRQRTKVERVKSRKPVLIAGIALDSERVIRLLEGDARPGLKGIGVLSNKLSDQGQIIRKIPVRGRIDDAAEILDLLSQDGTPISEVIMTPSALAPENAPEKLIKSCHERGIRVRRLGESLDVLASTKQLSLADIDVSDILFRDVRTASQEFVDPFVAGSRVVVTGGGGSIGGELVRRLLHFGASQVFVFDNSEEALYKMGLELADDVLSGRVQVRLADIRDRKALDRLLREIKPDHVVHAAALKQVPMLEDNWIEAIKTNIFGTVNVIDASLAHDVKSIVMISTDKAVHPASVLGATKRIAELYCVAVDQAKTRPASRVVAVRFGNVLGTKGSVVPLFRQQIERGGPVTLTHPDMTRYFMTPTEAADLVLGAAGSAIRALNRADMSVYVLEMGRPVKIKDLAETMIQLAGLEIGRDIEVKMTGLRPGERLDELLLADSEHQVDADCPGIFGVETGRIPLGVVNEQIAQIEAATETGDRNALYQALKSIEDAIVHTPAAGQEPASNVHRLHS